MLDLTKAILPEAVKVEGKYYKVHTSFKYWLRFLELIKEPDISPSFFDFMYKTDIPKNKEAGVLALLEFSITSGELPRKCADDDSIKVLDFKIDADFIYAGFLELYGIDLIDCVSLHWYKFNALLSGLHDVRLSKIIEYRSYEFTGKKKDEYVLQMEKLRGAWELPQEDESEDQDLKDFQELLKG